MIPFFIIFVIFLVLLNFQIHKNTRAQEDLEQQFWERERKSNAVRRQDISSLEYITLPVDLIPGNLGTDSEKALLALEGKQMLNLTSYTNTDLKLQYGAANLDALSRYETTYVDMVSHLAVYARELVEAGDTDSAEKLLSFAVSCKDDSAGIYLPLARIYKERGDIAAIDHLIATAEDLTTISKATLPARLREIASS